MYDLTLNCKMPRAQLRVTLTPKFSMLQRILLVITCAPSLESCYVFENIIQLLLHDFGKYDVEGTKAIQRWYKLDWSDNTGSIVKKIVNGLSSIVQGHIEGMVKHLREEG